MAIHVARVLGVHSDVLLLIVTQRTLFRFLSTMKFYIQNILQTIAHPSWVLHMSLQAELMQGTGTAAVNKACKHGCNGGLSLKQRSVPVLKLYHAWLILETFEFIMSRLGVL